ncbi:RNA polymerase factor sigma-54 [Aquabacterium fontiphilum]|uniref:RNA polymerase factor sigma-54 n=1 Tax=Aquabacterium fontiphilum TaxID=450365 RepID=UPI001378A153|nr:RNA polymerase factor sigma-54 [Aquabacterium fontiphilum]NBD22114.1 RNA polymerase factor sigma-54 [Aquabacterium fontiphilum]
MRSITVRTEHKQQQTLTPRLQQAVRLLQLSSLDFAQEVHAALGKNPFLEPLDEDESAQGSATAADGEDVAPVVALNTVDPVADGLASQPSEDMITPGSDAISDAPLTDDFAERDSWQIQGSGRQGSGDGETNVMDMVAADTSLRHHLHGQLNVMNISERERLLAKVIVESLDEDGYLREDLDELRELCELAPMAAPEEMQRALHHVQSLDPAGVGARTVAESLLLQLPAIACPEERELARLIVSHHLERLARHDLSGMARELGRSAEQVEAACNRIRRLDPRPGWRYGSPTAPYITPDVIVRKVRGQWVASLNNAIVPRVRLNQMYADLFQRHREGRHAELAAHLQEARWTIRNVEQRFATILQVTEAIIKRQRNFLEYGALAMKPLGLREIAEEVGLHESTVSRVTNNKYMSTPVGVFELKYFFSRAMPTATGGACSATAIRGVIQTMIDQEKPHEPLSDAEIARRLARQGLTVARRTVTKYRQAMRIAPVERRRRLA